MNKLLILLAILSLTSCAEYEYKIIYSKSHVTYVGDPLPEGICRFFYKINRERGAITFTEKCDTYYIGDTIHGLTLKTNK